MPFLNLSSLIHHQLHPGRLVIHLRVCIHSLAVLYLLRPAGDAELHHLRLLHRLWRLVVGVQVFVWRLAEDTGHLSADWALHFSFWVCALGYFLEAAEAHCVRA